MKFRPSSVGNLKGKGDKLTIGNKSYVEELANKNVYNYSESISSKYMDKGIECEQDSIDLLNKVRFETYSKHKDEDLENEWFKTIGCDILTTDSVIDIKTSWSKKTFPKTDEQALALIKKSGYDWQMYAYMSLYGVRKSEVVFCLVDTPDHLIEYENDISAHRMSDIYLSRRIRGVVIELDDSFFDAMIKRVEIGKDYYNEYLKQIKL